MHGHTQRTFSHIPVSIAPQQQQQAKVGRLHILNIMNEACPAPRQEMRPNVPRITTAKINPQYIGKLIGAFFLCGVSLCVVCGLCTFIYIYIQHTVVRVFVFLAYMCVWSVRVAVVHPPIPTNIYATPRRAQAPGAGRSAP